MLRRARTSQVCATSCFATKITEAGYLAPSVSATDLAGTTSLSPTRLHAFRANPHTPTALCETASFTQAYYNCMSYHCTPDEYQRGVVLGQVVCASVGAAIRKFPRPLSPRVQSESLTTVSAPFCSVCGDYGLSGGSARDSIVHTGRDRNTSL